MMVSYVWTMTLGNNTEGEVVSLEPEKAQPLLDAKLIREATAEDLGQTTDDTEPEDETDMPVTLSVDDLVKKIEDGLVEKIGNRLANKPNLMIDAEAKNKGYSSLGEAMRAKYHSHLAIKQGKASEYTRKLADMNWTGEFSLSKKSQGYNTTTDSAINNFEYSADLFQPKVGALDLRSLFGDKVQANAKTISCRHVTNTSLINGAIFGGINVVKRSEGVAPAASKGTFGSTDLATQSYSALAYVTREELMDNSYNLDQVFQNQVSDAFRLSINKDVVSGSAVPTEGLLNGSALVTITKENSGNAGLILHANVSKMISQLDPDQMEGAVWIANPSCRDSIERMAFSTGGTSSAQGLQYSVVNGPINQLKGFPVYYSWACETLGSLGDFFLVNFNDWKLYERPYIVDFSQDFSFDTFEIAYRFEQRVGFMNKWRTSRLGTDGHVSYSNAIALGAIGS